MASSLSAFRLSALRQVATQTSGTTITCRSALFPRTTGRQFATKNGRSSSRAMSPSEREQALRDANAKMKAYADNRPSLALLEESKRRSRRRDSEHRAQAALVGSFLAAFIAAALLGRRIAKDADFREKYIPAWYDFSIEKPEKAWTRQELHEQLVEVQRDLHERAIRGEFTPEKLEEMRRHFAGVDPEDDEHGWGKLHPGVDDDEDVEDD